LGNVLLSGHTHFLPDAFLFIVHPSEKAVEQLILVGRSRVKFSTRSLFPSNRPNLSSSNITLRSTHPLTEMGTKNLPGVKRGGHVRLKPSLITSEIILQKHSSVDCVGVNHRTVSGLKLPFGIRVLSLSSGKKAYSVGPRHYNLFLFTSNLRLPNCLLLQVIPQNLHKNFTSMRASGSKTQLPSSSGYPTKSV
jgi:hypothetical protein